MKTAGELLGEAEVAIREARAHVARLETLAQASYRRAREAGDRTFMIQCVRALTGAPLESCRQMVDDDLTGKSVLMG